MSDLLDTGALLHALHFAAEKHRDQRRKGLGQHPYINIEAARNSSGMGHPDRPMNREWHEFGHAVMVEAFGNRFPWNVGNTNHAGYTNPSSTDSLTEGFADFWSAIILMAWSARSFDK